MKVFKPFPLSLLTRCFEFRGRTSIGVSALVMVDLGAQRRLWQEKDLWTFWATRPESQWPLEEGMPRVRSEYLVSAVAYPGERRIGCVAAAQVGALSKRLLVYGKRYWDGDRISPPADFESLPLGWSDTWGGPACADNPLGMGMAAGDDGLRWLPRVEDPQRPLAAPRDIGRPVGFGPLDGTWPQRAAKRGTYDERWLKEEFPAVASDADWTTFNTAPEDQQQAEPFRGDEAYAFEHLHPTQPRLEGRLPGLRARAFVTHRTAEGDKFKELRLRLNTLWFFPDAQRAILVFQGMHEIAEDDGADIVHLLGALEDIDAPRPAAHYLGVRDKRMDREHGALETLRDEDLMPADLVVPLFDLAAQPNIALERGQRRARAEREAARAEVARWGMDPDDGHAPALDGPAIPEVKTLDDLIGLRKQLDQQRATLAAQAEKDKAAMLADVRKVFESQGQDFGLIEREMAGLETRGPPKPFAQPLIRSFEGYIAQGRALGGDVRELEEMLADKPLMDSWHQGDRKQLVAYRGAAHYQAPASRLRGEEAAALRQRLLSQRAAGGSCAGWDLTGADLSGLDLSGLDLQGALMESANLTGTLLGGANLCDAVLAHATLQSTLLAGARLDRANLGAAQVVRCDLSRASLAGTVLQKARVQESRLHGARIDGIRLEDATLVACDLSGVHSEAMLVFLRHDLRGCNFAGARLAQSTFVECDLTGADFGDAVLIKSAFVTVRAAGASFRGLRIESGCFAQGCVLDGCDFSGAVLPNISFRGAQLAGARFVGAQLSGADFSECELSGADFAQARLPGSRFVRARLHDTRMASSNLMNAVLQHARLSRTDFSRANLFQSDFARVRIEQHGPGFDTALTTRMRTYPRHRTAPGPVEAAHGQG